MRELDGERPHQHVASSRTSNVFGKHAMHANGGAMRKNACAFAREELGFANVFAWGASYVQVHSSTLQTIYAYEIVSL
jgi:hypothetical protein